MRRILILAALGCSVALAGRITELTDYWVEVLSPDGNSTLCRSDRENCDAFLAGMDLEVNLFAHVDPMVDGRFGGETLVRWEYVNRTANPGRLHFRAYAEFDSTFIVSGGTGSDTLVFTYFSPWDSDAWADLEPPSGYFSNIFELGAGGHFGWSSRVDFTYNEPFRISYGAAVVGTAPIYAMPDGSPEPGGPHIINVPFSGFIEESLSPPNTVLREVPEPSTAALVLVAGSIAVLGCSRARTRHGSSAA